MNEISPLRVTVAPAQTAYFAGEEFVVEVTFTNTNSVAGQNSSPAGSPSSYTPSSIFKHKRASHSVSSVALSKPPTSAAGTPRTVTPSKSQFNESSTSPPIKRGLLRGRSLSLDIEHTALSDAPASSDSFTFVPPHHPHARKISTFDGQNGLSDLQRSMSPFPPSPSVTSTTPSTSTFSLSLDPISEGTSSTSYRSHARKPAHLGNGALGYPSRMARRSEEVIMYSYAQLLGNVVITPPQLPAPSIEQTKNLESLRDQLSQRTLALGGGSMDIHAPSMSSTRHRRRSSFSAGLMSLVSSAAPVSLNLWGQTPPSDETITSPQDETPAGPDTPLPTLEVQPAMLAVDLTLAPGESRKYCYRFNIPAALPPTHKGPALKISYNLVVGVCRGSGADNTSRVMKVPIRIYNNVAVGQPVAPYDLLWPLERRSNPGTVSLPSVSECLPDQIPAQQQIKKTVSGNFEELQRYATQLLESHPAQPDHSPDVSSDFPGPNGYFALDCREAVEILTRTPKKVSYDVNKGEIKVAVLTFPKSSYRLGESVIGVVEANGRSNFARVLSLNASLETQETLPSSLYSDNGSAVTLRRVHAESHSSFVLSSLRTTFTLDIPSDASPAFQINYGSDTSPSGLVWRVRLKLAVAVASDTAEMRQMRPSDVRGEWGSTWTAMSEMAPKERLTSPDKTPSASWTDYFISAVKNDDEPGTAAGKEMWQSLKVETVECVVPIQIWPGNTPFRATDVIFGV